jgi:hypothetical protein
MGVSFLLWYGWILLGLAFVTLIGFFTETLSLMPKDQKMEKRPCDPKCWLPPLDHSVWDDSEYRCKDCGHTWLVNVDMNRPRDTYRQWALPKT